MPESDSPHPSPSLCNTAIQEGYPRLSFDYDEVIGRIKGICTDDSPTGSSVQLAFKQIDGIAKDIKKDSPVLEWDDDKLEITNPYFMFYLRSSHKIDKIHKGKSGMV